MTGDLPEPLVALVGRLRAVLTGGDAPRLRLAMLFGSIARGAGRADSDLDIAILPVDPDIPLAAELSLGARLEAATDRAVDIVRIDRASPLLAWRIARDGVVLLSEPATVAARFRARAAIEHADDADLRRDAARRYRAALVSGR